MKLSKLTMTEKQRANRRAVETDDTTTAVRNMTPAEFDTWCDANVTTLPQAIDLIRRHGHLIRYLFSVIDDIDERQPRTDPGGNHIEQPPATQTGKRSKAG